MENHYYKQQKTSNSVSISFLPTSLNKGLCRPLSLIIDTWNQWQPIHTHDRRLDYYSTKMPPKTYNVEHNNGLL